jgi:hypothetical protein
MNAFHIHRPHHPSQWLFPPPVSRVGGYFVCPPPDPIVIYLYNTAYLCHYEGKNSFQLLRIKGDTMFETITLGQAYLTIIVIGALTIILLLYIAFKLDSIAKQIDRQRDLSELKSQIVAEINKGKNIKD